MLSMMLEAANHVHSVRGRRGPLHADTISSIELQAVGVAFFAARRRNLQEEQRFESLVTVQMSRAFRLASRTASMIREH